MNAQITITRQEWEAVQQVMNVSEVETRWHKAQPNEITIICDRNTRDRIWEFCDSRHN